MNNFEKITQVWIDFDSVAHDLLKPLDTQESYQEAMKTIDDLMDLINESETPHPLESLLSILIERVIVYENSIVTLRNKRPAGILAYLMEDRNITQTELAEATGIEQSTISKLLRETRTFSANHIKILSKYFNIDTNAFL